MAPGPRGLAGDGLRETLRPGPVTVGFDHYFGIPASLDMPPYGSIRDDGLDEPPTEVFGDSAHRPQGGGGFFRGGAIAPDFRHIDVIPEIEREAVEFLVGRDASRLDRPFFLDVPLSAPYTPWLPTDAHLGRSGAGHYGDFTAQVDARIGRILVTLDRSKLSERTLVILTSECSHRLERVMNSTRSGGRPCGASTC